MRMKFIDDQNQHRRFVSTRVIHLGKIDHLASQGQSLLTLCSDAGDVLFIVVFVEGALGFSEGTLSFVVPSPSFVEGPLSFVEQSVKQVPNASNGNTEHQACLNINRNNTKSSTNKKKRSSQHITGSNNKSKSQGYRIKRLPDRRITGSPDYAQE